MELFETPHWRVLVEACAHDHHMVAGRIGLAVLRRHKPFDLHLHYMDRRRVSDEVEKELGLTCHAHVESALQVCDVVIANCPLHPWTEHVFNTGLIRKMTWASWRADAHILITAFVAEKVPR